MVLQIMYNHIANRINNLMTYILDPSSISPRKQGMLSYQVHKGGREIACKHMIVRYKTQNIDNKQVILSNDIRARSYAQFLSNYQFLFGDFMINWLNAFYVCVQVNLYACIYPFIHLSNHLSVLLYRESGIEIVRKRI